MVGKRTPSLNAKVDVEIFDLECQPAPAVQPVAMRSDAPEKQVEAAGQFPSLPLIPEALTLMYCTLCLSFP
jgi:hypothetical protein